MTARDLIKGSLRLIGVLATGETPSANEQTDALSVLNDMLDSWSTESLIIYSKVIETFALIGNQQAYTMGVGGNFNTARPLKIERAAIQVVGTNPLNEIPIQIVNLDQWANITVKGTQSSIPMKLYPSGSNPLETLNLWPIPSVANNIVLYSWKALTSIADANTTIVFPPGYAKALRYNLAMELCSEYGKEPGQVVALGAAESKENIKRMNMRPVYLEADQALVSHAKAFNWITGE